MARYSLSSRMVAMLRDRFRCIYCGRSALTGEIIDVEPIVPEALAELTTDKKPSGARTRKRSA